MSLALVASLLIASSASAVSMEWTFVGNPGNACDPQPDSVGGTGCYGAVGYAYKIGTYEVTNAQYAEFLNAKAASDPLGLYSTNMGSGFGGITRSGVSGSFTYSAISGRGDMPVNHVSFYDTLRFANWMNNGQGTGDTETGAYTLLGGTAGPSNGTTVTRNPSARIFLPSENEWYKAAYHDGIGLAATDYFDFPAGFDGQTACTNPGATPNTANCSSALSGLAVGGSYTGSASPYGTFDQGGNVWEWNETIITDPSPSRVIRGGGFASGRVNLAGSIRGNFGLAGGFEEGFRVAMIPEPSTGLLVIAGLLAIAGWHRVRA